MINFWYLMISLVVTVCVLWLTKFFKKHAVQYEGNFCILNEVEKNRNDYGFIYAGMLIYFCDNKHSSDNITLILFYIAVYSKWRVPQFIHCWSVIVPCLVNFVNKVLLQSQNSVAIMFCWITSAWTLLVCLLTLFGLLFFSNLILNLCLSSHHNSIHKFSPFS